MNQDFPYQGHLPRFNAPPELKARIFQALYKQRRLALTLWWSAAASLLLLLGLNLAFMNQSDQNAKGYSSISITTPLDPYAE